VSDLGRSPRCFRRAKLGVGSLALNTVEKSAEGIVGARQAKRVRHSRPKGGVTDRPSCNVEH